MSVKVMSLVWSWPLPATEKLVLLKLADCADDDGRNAFPSVLTIASTCGVTRRGAQKVLERLRTKGYITVQDDHTNRRSTVYRVALERPAGGEPGSPLEANDVRPKEEPRGEPGSPLEANDVRGGGEPGSPLEANDVRPIRPTTVLEPPCTRQSRAREPRVGLAYAGTVLEVPTFLAVEFGKRLNGQPFDLPSFFDTLDAQLVQTGAPWDIRWIREQFARASPSPARDHATTFTADERQRAARLLRAVGQCTHQPPHQTSAACVAEIILAWREQEQAVVEGQPA